MGQGVYDDAGSSGTGDDAGRMRTCAVTRAVLPTDELIRFVAAPDGQIIADLARKLPGRGVWVSCRRSAVETAQKTGAFSRSLRRRVSATPDLGADVEKLLISRSMSALSLANKAGELVAGFSKVENLIGASRCVALVHASDAADDGSGKLDRKFAAVAGTQYRPDALIKALTSAELSLAIGRPNVVHAALTKGGAAANFLKEAARLQRYRANEDALVKDPRSGANMEQV